MDTKLITEARVPFEKRAADNLADCVEALVAQRIIDSRSAAADALLDYRTIDPSNNNLSPMRTQRGDAIAALEQQNAALQAQVEEVKK